tara:strand:+ start:73341 stop:73748 length:408 start_codon:yes stop_codon:yes gene_type:complete
MTFIQIIYLYFLTIPVFFIIDLLWIGVIAKDFYRNQIGFLLGPVNWVAAIVFYLIFIAGILVFAVLPALDAGSLMKAVVLGAFFGFVAYATYDLTNLALTKNWPLMVTVVDMIWGAVIAGSVATASYLIATKLFS